MLKVILISVFLTCSLYLKSQDSVLIYHRIKTDSTGKIIPWFDPEPGKSFDHVINLVWNFWDTMRNATNGLPYYLSHQVWKPGVDDPRGAWR